MKAKGYLLVGKFYSRRVSTRYGDADDIVLARAYKGGREVYIGLNGKEVAYDPVSPIIFDPSSVPLIDDDEPESSNGYTKRHPYAEFSKNGKYGTKKRESDEIGLAPVYDKLSYARKDFFYIKLNNKVGIAAASGLVVVKPDYDSIKYEYDYYPRPQYYYHTWLNGKSGYIQKDFNELLAPFFDKAERINSLSTFFIVTKNKKKGLWSLGRLLIDTIYDEMYVEQKKRIIVKKGNYTGVVDSAGHFLLKLEPQTLNSQWPSRRFVIQKNDRFGLLDRDLKPIIPPVYNEIIDRHEDVITVKKGKKYGAFDRYGRLVVPIKFDEAYYAAPFIICYNRWDRFMQAAYYWDGKITASLKRQTLYPFGNTLVRGIGRSWQLLDTAGKKIKTFPYDKVIVDDGYLIVEKNGKYGVIDSAGNKLIPIRYHLVGDPDRYPLSDGFIEIKRGGKVFTIDLYGHELPGSYPQPSSYMNE